MNSNFNQQKPTTVNGLFGTLTKKNLEICWWAVGGAGTNIMSELGEFKDLTGIADTVVRYIDTSRSNLNSNINPDNFFVVTQNGEELDGSGGVRATNVEPIAADMRNVIKQYKPSKFNFVVGSIAGGSGSVILPLLVQELLAAGEHVAVVIIGSSESEIRAINTSRSISSLEAIAVNNNRPLMAVYIDAERGVLRKKIDKEVQRAVGKLSMFHSGQFHGLDTRDISNFYDYTKIPSMSDVKPQLCILSMHDRNEHLKEYSHGVLSIASLYTTPDVQPHDRDSRYDCVGYGTLANLPDQTCLHFVVSADEVEAVHQRLRGRAETVTEKVKDAVTRESIVKDAKPGRHNLVL